jgi:uncharacterized membrane protein/predicted DsbA family dithiol-disulfide isomerase
MRDHVKRAILVILIGVVGLIVSAWTEILHRELTINAAYTSFCNVNATINCDRVLTSRWAELRGVSVALLAALYYAIQLVAAVVLVTSGQATRRRQLADLLLLQAFGGLAFSVYMAGIAIGVIGTVCLMCSTLYVIAVLQLVAVWRLRSVTYAVNRRQQASRAETDRRVLLAGGGLILLMFALVAWEVLDAEPVPVSAEEIRRSDPEFYEWYRSQPLKSVESRGRNDRGSSSAGITLVEFSDFECAHCNQFHLVLDELWREFSTDLRVIFRHFPLDSDCNKAVSSRLHRVACLAAVAAECAGEQGRFWEYHDRLFHHQQKLSRQLLLSLAGEMALDRGAFEQCLQSPEMRARVEADARAGSELGVNSTPTLFINGRMIKGALDVAGLRKALVLAREP